MLPAKISDALKEMFAAVEIILVGFKIKFGKTVNGDIVLADEMSSDTFLMGCLNNEET